MRKLQKEAVRGKSVEKGFELLRIQLDVDSAVEKKLAEYGEKQGTFCFREENNLKSPG
jgi:hypothetical protein